MEMVSLLCELCGIFIESRVLESKGKRFWRSVRWFGVQDALPRENQNGPTL